MSAIEIIYGLTLLLLSISFCFNAVNGRTHQKRLCDLTGELARLRDTLSGEKVMESSPSASMIESPHFRRGDDSAA